MVAGMANMFDTVIWFSFRGVLVTYRGSGLCPWRPGGPPGLQALRRAIKLSIIDNNNVSTDSLAGRLLQRRVNSSKRDTLCYLVGFSLILLESLASKSGHTTLANPAISTISSSDMRFLSAPWKLDSLSLQDSVIDRYNLGLVIGDTTKEV